MLANLPRDHNEKTMQDHQLKNALKPVKLRKNGILGLRAKSDSRLLLIEQKGKDGENSLSRKKRLLSQSKFYKEDKDSQVNDDIENDKSNNGQ